MFTIEQIKAAHSKVKSGADFPNYVQDLIKLGITSYETLVADGKTTYFGQQGFTVETEPVYAKLSVAEISNKTQFITDLRNHQKGNTNYPTFCSDCATSGIEKWVVNMTQMSCTYYDKSSKEILVEKIPVA
ncbi:DUF1398 family protein [Polaribacter sp. BAL334]|uniref:DUF1398 domain-containing protein n=1 Tax=Polaribacter sp. BAL334 TaxID=1708178 RepID=UPI0018D23E8C|nr:DUF1398 family protein [Polaribacter sp. BAL334]MBG7613444.1 DUF1398 family protein [Polaribacter sp. BAL334]